jgi:hypothetical protein
LIGTRRNSEGALLDREWYLSCFQVLRISNSQNSAHEEPFAQARARLLRSHHRPRSQALCVSKTSEFKMNRKRRTVLWLYTEDYEYLSAVAEHDMDSKNVSMHRLVKALRAAGVKSFLRFEETLRRLPPAQGRV